MRWDAERHAHEAPVDGCMGMQSDATANRRRLCARRRDVVTWSAPPAQTKDGATGHSTSCFLIVPHHNWTKSALLSNTGPTALCGGHLVHLDGCAHGLLCWTIISLVQFFAVGSPRPSVGSRPSPPTSRPSNRRILIGKSVEQRCTISAVYRCT